MQKLIVPQGQFQLERFPPSKDVTLRAWDSADEYLLQYFAETESSKSKLLIINDNFGALSVALSEQAPVMWTDSILAQQALRNNLIINNINETQITPLSSIQQPDTLFDWVLIKVPKSHAMLEDVLYRLIPHIHSNTQIVAAAMVKNIHSSTLNIFTTILGHTKTSLARKKSRLIFCQAENLEPKASPYPKSYKMEDSDITLSNHANIFSREKLDAGTRLLLQHIPVTGHYQNIIDLGCGNGIVGIIAAINFQQAKVSFVDESYMAVHSAEENARSALTETDRLDFKVTNCLSGITTNSADLILNNPPFHQHHITNDYIAWQMFTESKKVLIKNGQLWVVGNRHLGYHIKMKKIFGNCENMASNHKFVILKSVK